MFIILVWWNNKRQALHTYPLIPFLGNDLVLFILLEKMADKEMKLGRVIDYLKGPIPVQKFQKLCGISLEECEGNQDKKKIKIERKWLHWLMLFGTSLGDELFYSVFFTFWFFNVESFCGRRVVAVWGICMYIGMSNILNWIYFFVILFSIVTNSYNFE